MSDKLVILQTAEGCPGCHYQRGDGILNNGHPYMTYPFLKKIIIPAEKKDTIFLNIHYNSTMGKNRNIREISKFFSYRGGIMQERYYSKGDFSFTENIFIGKDRKVKRMGETQIKEGGVGEIVWVRLLDEKISPKLSNYSYGFPQFIITTKDGWKKSITEGKQMVAITGNGPNKEYENGEIGIDVKNAFRIEIHDLIRKFLIEDKEITISAKMANV
jgi:hypothetical protein